MFEKAGVTVLDDPNTSRKLILDTSDPQIKFVVIRSTDVTTYVEFGAADLGIVGKDVLMEHGGSGLSELLDLKFSQCRMMVAQSKASSDTINGTRLRVATKYMHTAQRYFASQGIQVELIKLYGSMELAPLVGLADRIVDLVDTGNTLKANGLVATEKIADISARLIVNSASERLKTAKITPVVEALMAQVSLS